MGFEVACIGGVVANMTFEESVGLLAELGVDFVQDSEYRTIGDKRQEVLLPLIKKIQVPFTPEEWWNACTRDGAWYIGGCCGTTSAIQDVLNDAFRNSGWMDAPAFHQMVEAYVLHGGEEQKTFSDKDLEIIRGGWKEGAPWEKLEVLWVLVKEHLVKELPRGGGDHLSEVDHAFGDLQRALQWLSFRHLFQIPDVDQLLGVYKMIPSLKILNDNLRNIAPPVFEGVAILDNSVKQTPLKVNHIAQGQKGFCLYPTREEAEETLKLWQEDRDKYENYKGPAIKDQYSLCSVRITLENGCEFLEGAP